MTPAGKREHVGTLVRKVMTSGNGERRRRVVALHRFVRAQRGDIPRLWYVPVRRGTGDDKTGQDPTNLALAAEPQMGRTNGCANRLNRYRAWSWRRRRSSSRRFAIRAVSVEIFDARQIK